MSVTDPIFKPLKHCIYKLVTGSQPITDQHESLKNFCELVEIILRKGTKHGQQFLLDMFVPRDYWHCIEQLHQSTGDLSSHTIRKPPQFDVIVDKVRNSSKVTSAQGRGRYFLRLALHNRILHSVVELLLTNQEIVELWYDPQKSVIAHPILSEIFLSLLRQVSELTFQLCVKNHSFLDETWILPVYAELTLCPSRDLGLCLHHINGRVMVMSLVAGSLTADSGQIEEGDLLDELFDIPLRNISKGTIPSRLKKHSDEPIVLAVAKRKLEDGSKFPPIESLMKTIRRSSGKSTDQSGVEETQLTPSNDGEKSEKADFSVTYIGSLPLKQNGSVDNIELAINTVVQRKQQVNKPVIITLGETELVLKDVVSNKIIDRHSYTYITACGRCEAKPQHIAYIVGDNTCLLASQFTGHVFNTESLLDSRAILQSIADGFERTHWFV